MVSQSQTLNKDKKYRKFFKHTEYLRRKYKFLKIQSTLTGHMPLITLPKAIFKNNCLVTGETRSIYSKRFRLSRHQIKEFFPFIKSLRNSSW